MKKNIKGILEKNVKRNRKWNKKKAAAKTMLAFCLCLSSWLFLPEGKAEALDMRDFGWEWMYREFLDGNLKTYIKEGALEEAFLDEGHFQKGTGYTFSEILRQVQEDYRLEGKVPLVDYAYLDCGGDGYMDLAVRFRTMNAWDDTLLLVFYRQSGYLELRYGISSWSRSREELYYYGFLDSEGTSGAAYEHFSQMFLDGNGKLGVLYTMHRNWDLLSRNEEEYQRLFWNLGEGKERTDPYISLDRYDIGGTGNTDHTVYRIEEEDPELVKRCEEYGDIIRQQEVQLYTQEEIDRLIGKQKEKLGIHDLWMQKRKLEWRAVPVEKYGTCVEEDMEGEMKWLLWHFLACTPDTFGEKYNLTQLYRNGILYGTGEIKELRFLAEQPCAVYEGMNVGIVRERGGIPDGDARIRIDDSTELGIYLLEEQDGAVSVYWKKREDGKWQIREISYLCVNRCLDGTPYPYQYPEQESEDERTPPSVFSSWEEAYYREPDSRKREGFRYLSPDRTGMIMEGLHDPRQIYIGDRNGRITDIHVTGERSMTVWIGEEHLLYRKISGEVCLLHLEDGQVERVSEGTGYTGYLLDGEYIIGKNRTESRVMWKIAQDGADVELVNVESQNLSCPPEPEAGTTEGLFRQFLDGQRAVTMGDEWEKKFFGFNGEDVSAGEYSLPELMERVKEEYWEEGDGKPFEFQYAYLDCGGDGKLDLAVRFRRIYDCDECSNLMFLIMNRNGRLEVVYGRLSHNKDDAQLYYNGYVWHWGYAGTGAYVCGESLIGKDGRETVIVERNVMWGDWITEADLPAFSAVFSEEDRKTKNMLMEEWKLGEDTFHNFDMFRQLYEKQYDEYLSLAAGEGICFQTFDELKGRREKRLAWFGIDSKWLVQKKLIWME